MLTSPSRGQRLAGAILRSLGWTLLPPGEIPAKAVLIAYPHTSNWDFIFTMLAKWALGLEVFWVGKDTLFRWPFGPLLRRMGGIPVNRRQRTGFVEQMVEEFARRETFHLAIAPEGTRRHTEGWKSGFYRIALGARVPLALAAIDYRRREVGLVGLFTPCGNPETDMARIAEHYAGRRACHPEDAAPITLLPGKDSPSA